MRLKYLLLALDVAGGVLAAARPDIFSELNKRATCNLHEPAPKIKAPRKNVWDQISPEDNLAVWNLLHDPETGLNLTNPTTATLTDNYVFWIDTLHTNKTDVLPYLSSCARPPPPKYARAVIFFGGKEDPDSQEYMIGPLPVGPETKVEKLDYIYNGGDGGRVPYNARYWDAKRSAPTEPLLISIMSSISDITEALLGGSYFGSSSANTTLTTSSPTPVSFDGTQAFRSILFRYPGTASYLTPLDFYVLLDCPGTDPRHYSLKGIVTNDRFFPTVADIREAFEAGELSMEVQQTRETDWAMLDWKSDNGARPLEDRLAPQSLELGGKRYKVDEEQRYVEYMGWSFYVAYTRTLGVMYYDIKYKGERILYELSLQEAAAQYAGFQPKAAGTVYHDTSLGSLMGTLVEGYDCPFGSTLWNLTYHAGNSSRTNADAFCIFESDSGYPMSRHRYSGGNDFGFNYLGTVKGSALTTRSISTIGNYDYLFDYIFHVDGSIEIVCRASGYLQSSFYYPKQGKFGPRVQQGTMGSLHDHILTYKADFDILDTKNSLEVSELVVVNQTQPWFPELGSFEQMELAKSTKQTEEQFNWQENNRAMYCVVSTNATNAWGERRGYRIVPGKSNIHLTPLQSPFSRDQTAFAKSHLALTRQKDTEPFATSFANVNLPMKPQHDFLKMVDGEGVDGEDLVVWFNLGMHHFTRAEDIPVTLYTEAVSSILFAPQNFNDHAEDVDIMNRRWITYDSDSDSLKFDAYGVELPQCQVELPEPVLGINRNT